MRLLISCALLLTALAPAFSQPANPGPALPTDPRALINAARAFYNFPSPEMKPWHIKAEYQLYSPEGKPTDKGTFEFWWASPKVHRSSWTRAGAERSEWSTADGTVYAKTSGTPLRYFERTMDEILFSPVPWSQIQDSASNSTGLELLPPKKPEVACLVETPKPATSNNSQVKPEGNFYCFDPVVTGLRLVVSQHLRTYYSDIIKTQGRYLAKQVTIKGDDRQTLLSISIGTFEVLQPAAATFNPPADATLEEPVISTRELTASGGTAGSLVKKMMPDYPLLAKFGNQQGVIVLAYVIGKDGKIHDLEVLSSTSLALEHATVNAVKTWKYKPSLLKSGKPVEVRSLVVATFAIGG